MKSILRFLLTAVLLLGCALPAIAADEPVRSLEDAQRVFDEANARYEDGLFPESFSLYQRLYRAGFGTREVMGNAGNAAYRANDVGRAVLFYRRALRADPGYAQAAENLRRVEPKSETAPRTDSAALLAEWFRMTPTWLWLAFAELGFAGVLIALFYAGRTEPGTERRTEWLSRLAVATILCVAFAGTVGLHDRLRQGDADAVVVQDRVVTRTGPGENFFQQLELPAGTSVRLLAEPEYGWVRFRLADGGQGYIPTSALERI